MSLILEVCSGDWMGNGVAVLIALRKTGGVKLASLVLMDSCHASDNEIMVARNLFKIAVLIAMVLSVCSGCAKAPEEESPSVANPEPASQVEPRYLYVASGVLPINFRIKVSPV